MSASTIIWTSRVKSTSGFQPSCRCALLRVANQVIDFGRAQEGRIELHVFLPVEAGMRERDLDQIADRMRDAGRR